MFRKTMQTALSVFNCTLYYFMIYSFSQVDNDIQSSLREDTSDIDTMVSLSNYSYTEDSVSSIGFPDYDDIKVRCNLKNFTPYNMNCIWRNLLILSLKNINLTLLEAVILLVKWVGGLVILGSAKSLLLYVSTNRPKKVFFDFEHIHRYTVKASFSYPNGTKNTYSTRNQKICSSYSATF